MKITGSGGGGKGSSSGGQQAQNTLRSVTIARVVELLSEGEIVGLVNGAQSIYFNQTPLQNADGSYNFGGLFVWNSTTNSYDPVTSGTVLTGSDVWIPGVIWDQRVGLPDQAVLSGFAQSETSFAVEERIKSSIGPVIRTITDTNVNVVKVVVRIPALAYLDPSNGDLLAYSVAWSIDVAPAGGAYVNAATVSLDNQKCTSPYERQTIVNLPAGGAPWNIRVTRLTADADTNANIQDETWWESYTEIVMGQFIYPNTALVALALDSQYFGSSIPTRGYHVKGLKTDVPSNWDPVTRVYTGVWDGTFVKAWHNNPAWVLYALLTNDRWGIGEFIDASTVDKWGLYQIATYCDELVPSGFTNPDSTPIMEPRFTYNGVINSREEAYKVLQGVAAAFRGMAYWSIGQVFAIADMPTDPITTVSPANVIGGAFNYSGTALKARHSVAMVSWNDPQDFYRPAIETVQNDAMIRRFGWRQIDVVAAGCTSRGQAHRYGKWILDTEEFSTETVEFTMSWDGYILQSGTTLKPGDIIYVADPRKTGGARIGGRMAAVTSTSVMTIDAPFVPTGGDSYTLTVMQPDGTIETRSIVSFDGTHTILTMSPAFSQTPVAGTMWVIQGTDVNPRQYRVLSVQEQDSHLFKIVALFFDPTKFARVELDITLAPIAYTRPSNVMAPPSNPTIVESNYYENGAPQSRVTLSWTAPTGTVVANYAITASSPRGSVDFGTTTSVSIDLFNIVPGDWIFYIASVSPTGLRSINLPLAYTVLGWSIVTVPTVESLALLGGGNEFTGTAPTIVWANIFPSGTVPYTLNNIVRVYDVSSSALLRTETVVGLSYTYSYEDNVNDGGPRRSLQFDVTAVSLLGIEQPVPAVIVVSNPSPAAVTPIVSSVDVSVTASWSVTDNDYFQSMCWISSFSGFDPLVTTPAYEGPDTTAIMMETFTGLVYVRVGAYDKFGKAGMNIGPEVAISCTGMSLAAFDAQLQDQITTQFQAVTDSIAQTQGLIASVSAEQDAANWLDKYNVKGLLNANVVLLTATMDQNFIDLNTAISTAIATTENYTDSAISTYGVTVAATYGTQASIALAQATAIATSESYADSSISSFNVTVQALYATKSSVATAVSGAITTANSNANAALSAYEITVSATYATLSGLATAAANATAAAESNAAAALAAYKVTVTASLASLSANVTTNANAVATLNSSLSSYETTTNASVGSLSASVSTNATAVATINGKVAGQYLVTLDVNGYVSGIKAYNNGAISNLTVITDNFEIASPGHSGGAPIPVFVIAVVNGVAKLALRGDMLIDGSITAKSMAAGTITAVSGVIGALAVNTLQLAGNAVTVPLLISAPGGSLSPQTNQQVLAGNMVVTGVVGQSYTITADALLTMTSVSSSYSYSARLWINGSIVCNAANALVLTTFIPLVGAYTFTSTGTDTIPLMIDWSSTGPSDTLGPTTLVAMTVKR